MISGSRRRRSPAAFVLLALATIPLLAVAVGRSQPARTLAGAPALRVTPAGADARCSRHGAPCGSLGGAYAKALAGDVIEVAPGSYPGQRLSQRALAGGRVVLRAARGGAVSVAGLDVNTGSVLIEGIRLTDGLSVEPASRSGGPSSVADVTLRGVSMPWAFIYADRTRLEGGSVGGFSACDTRNLEDGIDIWERNGVPTNGVTISGVLIHDVDGGSDGTCSGTAGAGRHVDCIQVLGGRNVTIRNSIFVRCATSGVLGRPYEGAALGPVTIENNVFGQVLHPGSAINLGSSTGGDACAGPMVVRANTIISGGVNGGCDGPTIEVTSNILETGACSNRLSYNGNVFQRGYSARCGASSRSCSVKYVAAAGGLPDYHLARDDRCARGAGVATGVRNDIDGDLRPAAAAPDAGADQWGSAAIVFGHSIGRMAMGEQRVQLETFYGKAVRLRAVSGGLEASYAGEGGRLTVVYRGERVIRIGTASPYYRTSSGLGPGTPVAAAAVGVAGFRWVECRAAFVRQYGSVAVLIQPAGGRNGKVVRSVALLRGRGAAC